MPQTREQLAERVRQKDAAALPEFLTVVRFQLLAFIERQLGAALRRKLEAEDIFQEVSADAVRSLAEIDLTGRDPFGWLCQIAERRIVDAHRHFFSAQKRDAGREVGLGSPGSSSTPGLLNLLVASMTTPSAAFSRNVKEARLAEALAELPEDQREAIRLRYVDNLPSKQIAERLGKSDAAIRVMLTRSIKKLQSIMGVEHTDG